MRPLAVLLAVLVLVLVFVAGCNGFPGADGRYATPARGGWDNFRAEAPGQYGVPSLCAKANRPSAPALPCRSMSG